ncbi:restriction endonuclease subunit S [Clostridium botulinum]|uniref:Restriction modification system DNA specificity domain protein n=2 Tax=Clostridium botulinum TaxID=1491 RepID=C1FTU2_CLOBJ|nr:restriction endonuclease subunit S [Clostridium botulinum]ACO85550.1 restriction modification system DNA specificity domain protein [Clostridium botulinum A2 str. Kyoto]APH24331.1 type I restriction modification DNA specificity domain protein [Clostridium botulinum]APQ68005.1 type I restriction modification DNA specificity domain protein [Clostridium botulinum]APQ78526.1 type I restriction modification DNA specificity domain protein [Clostridium botulinum]EPS53502.1 restriction modification
MDIKKIKCSEIIDVRDGTHDSPRYQSKGYPLVTSKNIKGNKIDFNNVNFISEEDYNKINMRSAVHNGDILMPMIGTIGNPVLVNTNKKFAIKNVALFKLSNNNKVDSKYFYYLLTSDIVKNQLENRKRGGTQNFVSLSNIRSLEIPLVPIEKQIFISNILDKAKSLIDKRKAQIEDLDELVKSRFIEMFGDTKLNPFKWEVYRLEEIYYIIDGDRGKNYPKQDEFFERNYCLFLNAGNVTSKGFCFDKSSFIAKEKDEILRKGKLQREDLVVTTRGTVGNIAYYNDNVPYDNIRINSGMVILRKRKEINPLYFISYFSNKLVYQSLISGTAQPQMPISNMKNANIYYPPIQLQNEFAGFVNQVDKLKFEMEKSLKELEDNFNSLMQKAFKGELFN